MKILKCKFCNDKIKENKDGEWGSLPFIHIKDNQKKNHDAFPKQTVKIGRPQSPPRKREIKEIA